MTRSAPTRSMRRHLLLLLLGLVATIWIATAIVSYFDARHELDELLDAHLAQSASLLIARGGDDLDEIVEHSQELHPYARRVAFQLWEAGRILRLHSPNAPDVRMSSHDQGFSDAQVNGRRWRIFSGWDRERRYLVQVGEPARSRDEIIGTVIKNMLLPMAVALPVLAVLIWLAIERVMRPLRFLNRQVEDRAADNLAPLELGNAPAEVAPLATNLNRLFDRVRASIDNERHFTADAAHELRTPLAAIRAQAQVARGSIVDAERSHALDSVIAGCDRATHLVEQLLTLARLEPERFRAARAASDLRTIARTSIAAIAPSALQNAIDIVLDEGPPAGVQADARLLEILLRNLLDNAVRYSPPGTTVRVRVGRRAGASFVTIEDQGPGVPREAIAQLGRRFHRLEPGGVAGTGLGLSIVKRIAELHGATVTFDRADSRGLAVTVTFPS
jgi:two-component system, OmpR family, sensor histidine kinase QseC